MTYTFDVQEVTRPVPPSRSEHGPAIEAALATVGTGRSVVITPGKGIEASKLVARLRWATCTRAKKLGRAVVVRGVVQDGKVVLWCESKNGSAPTLPVPPAAAAPSTSKAPAPIASHPFDPIEARVIKALEVDETGGLTLQLLSRAVYGRTDAERKSTGLLIVLNNLCKRTLLLQDGEKRYTLGRGVRSGIA